MEEVAPVVTPAATLSVVKGATAGASNTPTAKVVASTDEKEEAEGMGDNRNQNILSGNVGSKIPHTLSENTCIFGPRPEYLWFFHILGMAKKLELLVVSKCTNLETQWR